VAGVALLLGVTALSSAAVDVELARQQWQEGSRRLDEARADPVRYTRLHREVELVLADLRRRMGQTFTLGELAAAYSGADDWARALLTDEAPDDGPPPEAALAADAAFHLYARGAADYSP
jgi:hypothetical protein